jgi:hypothetical protein
VEAVKNKEGIPENEKRLVFPAHLPQPATDAHAQIETDEGGIEDEDATELAQKAVETLPERKNELEAIREELKKQREKNDILKKQLDEAMGDDAGDDEINDKEKGDETQEAREQEVDEKMNELALSAIGSSLREKDAFRVMGILFSAYTNSGTEIKSADDLLNGLSDEHTLEINDILKSNNNASDVIISNLATEVVKTNVQGYFGNGSDEEDEWLIPQTSERYARDFWSFLHEEDVEDDVNAGNKPEFTAETVNADRDASIRKKITDISNETDDKKLKILQVDLLAEVDLLADEAVKRGRIEEAFSEPKPKKQKPDAGSLEERLANVERERDELRVKYSTLVQTENDAAKRLQKEESQRKMAIESAQQIANRAKKEATEAMEKVKQLTMLVNHLANTKNDEDKHAIQRVINMIARGGTQKSSVLESSEEE